MSTVADNLQALNNAKQAIKTAIEEKGQDLSGVPFTAYAEKIAEIKSGGVEMTSGSFLRVSGYDALTLAHGLSKPPKLVVCFYRGFETYYGVYLAGFTYTDKVATLYRFNSTTAATMGAIAITKEGAHPTYGAITADGENIYVGSPPNQWTKGEYDWEAYTW